jgi:hypothetical protein
VIADPAEFLDLARLVAARADAVLTVRDQLSRRLGAARWTGPGADTFRASADLLARIFAGDADSLQAAATDLRRMADQLTTELEQLRGIETAVRAWLSANPPGISPIPSPWPVADLPPSGDPRWRQVQQAFDAAGIHLHIAAAPPPVIAGGQPLPVPGDLVVNNPHDFAVATLNAMGAPVTDANVSSLVNWANREGGNWHNTAAFNPLNTTQRMPGYTMTGSQGNIGAYTSWSQGVTATVTTLHNGHYNDIVAALMAGKGLGHGRFQSLLTWSGGGYDHV